MITFLEAISRYQYGSPEFEQVEYASFLNQIKVYNIHE